MRRLFNQEHWFGKIVSELKPFYVYALFAALLTNILALTVSIFSLVVYDRVIPSQSDASLYILLFGVLLFLFLDYLIRRLKTGLLDQANQEIDVQLTETIFREVISKQKAQKMSDGEVASAVKDFDSFKEFLGAATLSTFVDIPFAILFIAVLFLIAPIAALVPLVSILVLTLIGLLGYWKSQEVTSELNEVKRSRHSALIEVLGIKDLLSSLHSSDFFHRSWSASSISQAEKNRQSKEVLNEATNRVQLVTSVSQVVVLSTGALLAMQGQIGTGALVAISIISMRALAPFSQVVSLLSRLESALQSFKTLDAIIGNTDAASEMKLNETQVDPKKLPASVDVRTVSFQFAGQQKATLLNVSFKIEAGSKLAVLGKTGSGKTSLLRIIIGVQDSSRGEVLYGGLRFDTLSSSARAQVMACCFQDPLLFSGTLLENIALGKTDGQTGRLFDVLSICALEGLVSGFKEGLNHRIHQRGQGLSGGERQLIALARTLYRDVPVYLLDEPSSHLDPNTEALIVENLKAFLKEKTVIFTTHKPKFLDISSHCLVLDEGRVKKFGPTAAMLASAPSDGALEKAA